jgi:small subunit ribosomal protein S14
MGIKKVYKDLKGRIKFNFFEKKRHVCSFLLNRKDTNKDRHYRITNIINQIPVTATATRIRNRCILTGRSRGILSQYKLSRHMFKKLVNNGQITGYRKV